MGECARGVPFVHQHGCLGGARPGEYVGKVHCLGPVRELPLLTTVPAVAEIVAPYIRHRLMAADSGGDALHLALASYHTCDFLLTWNCRHLASAKKFGHIPRVNTMLELFVLTLITPLELLEESPDAYE